MDENYLMLSGISHFIYCRRRWALIHVEHQWTENYFTVEGNIVHERCHDETFTESRDDLLICRGMRIFSARLGVSGQCDVVEFKRINDAEGGTGAILASKAGLWQPCPVEYKRGKSKMDDSDRLQLCGQVMCLEEMFCCDIDVGYLYYNEVRRREKVLLTEELRREVREKLQEMHGYFERGYTPKAKPSKKCGNCSMKDICLPKLPKRKTPSSYYGEMLEEV